MIWLNLDVVPPPTPADPLEEINTCSWAHLLRLLPHLRVWGITSPLKLEEP